MSSKETIPTEASPVAKQTWECWNCGRRHEFHKKELVPAYGKTCMKCCKPNHFAAKCRSQGTPSFVRSVGDEENRDSPEKTFPMEVAGVTSSVWLESGGHIRFQDDAGSTVQCGATGHIQESDQRYFTDPHDSSPHENHCVWRHDTACCWNSTSAGVAGSWWTVTTYNRCWEGKTV